MPRCRGCVVHGMWLTQRVGATRKDLDAVERCPLSVQRISEAAARVTGPVADPGETEKQDADTHPSGRSTDPRSDRCCLITIAHQHPAIFRQVFPVPVL